MRLRLADELKFVGGGENVNQTGLKNWLFQRKD